MSRVALIEWVRVDSGLYQAGWLTIQRTAMNEWVVSDDTPARRDANGLPRVVATCVQTLAEAQARAHAWCIEMGGAGL